MTWRTIAIDAMRKMDDEYLTAAAGPTSHSPPPIEVAAMIAPGPITFSMLRKLKDGGAGRSETFHGGSAPCPGGNVASVPRDTAADPVGFGIYVYEFCGRFAVHVAPRYSPRLSVPSIVAPDTLPLNR